MRQAEARLLRQHVDGIFTRNPQERLVVYGDFNDTRASDSLKIITGTYGESDYLTPLPAEDRSGTSWTHFWDLHDVYARIDFVTVSKALKADTDFRAAKVLDDKEWEIASDHRPVLAVFR
jgi:endonuclease/exonuclease/phosphatase family metal-dependent hydrolase